MRVDVRGRGTDRGEASRLPPAISRSNSRGRQALQESPLVHLRHEQQMHSPQLSNYQPPISQLPQYDLQHQQQLQMKLKSQSVEARQIEIKNEQDKRASSVEGRIEGREGDSYIPDKKPVLNIQISSYQERVLPTPQPLVTNIENNFELRNNIKKAKSFREVERPAVRRDSARRSWFGRETFTDYPVPGNARLSASYDSLEDKMVTHKQPPVPSDSITSLITKEQKMSTAPKAAISPTLSSTVSSTDSLTTTEIPGVYIRPLSQYKKSPDLETNLEAQVLCNTSIERVDSLEGTSGPLSLDSSITLIPMEEECIRKTISSSQVSANIHTPGNVENVSTHTYNKVFSYSSEPASTHFIKRSQIHGTEVSAKSNESMPKALRSGPGPANVLRSMSLSTSDANNYGIVYRRASSADELEAKEHIEDNISSTRNKLKRRDSSLSRRGSNQEPTSQVVPEFMRIQLNKVECKPQRIIYSTEADDHEEKLKSSEENLTREFDTNVVSDVDVVTKSENAALDAQDSTDERIRRASTTSQLSQSSNVTESEEVLLRRPLRREKSLIIDTSQVTKNEEEPELFKVFARRSFKVRESFSIASSTEGQIDNTDNVNLTSIATPISGITKINPLYSTPTPPGTPVSPLQTRKTSLASSTSPPPSPGSISPLPPILTNTSTKYETPLYSSHINSVPPVSLSYQNSGFRGSCTPSKNIGSVASKQLFTSPSTKVESSARMPSMSASDIKTNDASLNSQQTDTIKASISTSAHEDSFNSSIVNRASSFVVDPNVNKFSSTVTRVTISSATLSPAISTSSSVVNVNSNVSSTVVWPPKSSSTKTSSTKITPLSSQVKPEQISKYITPKKTVEIVSAPVESSETQSNNETTTAVDDSSSLSQVQAVRKKFMVSETNKSISNISSSPHSSSHLVTRVPTTSTTTVIEARNIAPAFTVTVRSTQCRQASAAYNPPSRSHSSAGSSPSPSSARSTSPQAVSHHRHSIGGVYIPHPRQQFSTSSPSPPIAKRSISGPEEPSTADIIATTRTPVPHSSIIQSAFKSAQYGSATILSNQSTGGHIACGMESSSSPIPSSGEPHETAASGDDWRALVRQRRVDRLKQSKSVEGAVDEPHEASSNFLINLSLNNKI